MHWARRRLLLIGLLTIVAGVAVVGERVSAQSATGADVKAAFLFNFAKFVEWPAAALPAGQPIVIGVLGSSTIADALVRVASGRTVGGHSIQVNRLPPAEDPGVVHLLFIDNSERDRIGDLVKKIGRGSVLTVSDAPRFLVAGGVIQLRGEDGRIRFDVDLERAREAQLLINSKLLALAGIVNPEKAY